MNISYKERRTLACYLEKASDVFRFMDQDGIYHHYECRSVVKRVEKQIHTIPPPKIE